MKFSDTNSKGEKRKSEWHAVCMLGLYSEAADALEVLTWTTTNCCLNPALGEPQACCNLQTLFSFTQDMSTSPQAMPKPAESSYCRVSARGNQMCLHMGHPHTAIRLPLMHCFLAGHLNWALNQDIIHYWESKVGGSETQRDCDTCSASLFLFSLSGNLEFLNLSADYVLHLSLSLFVKFDWIHTLLRTQSTAQGCWDSCTPG